MDTRIEHITAREILDSRGNPTIEVELKAGGHKFRAGVPSGASTGAHEAWELRDQEERYRGKGVRKAVSNVKERIAPKLAGLDCTQQETLDTHLIELDGTPNKSTLGANAILGVSMAACRAAAALTRVPLHAHLAALSGNQGVILPVPQMNVLNGGKHAGMDNDIQEHMIMPVGARSFAEALRMGAEIYHVLYRLIKADYGAQGIHLGDEGGFVPPIPGVRDRLRLISKAMDESGYASGVVMALDAAASEFCREGTYTFGKAVMSSKDLVSFYAELAEEFPIFSIEDGMDEDDWEGWRLLHERLGDRMQIVGDDLFVTNPERIKQGIDRGSANALLLKVNQIGTVTESIQAASLCRKAGWGIVVSHRSGETEDAFIADLAVGLDCGQSKFGAPARSDRNAKYNQLLRIEERLGSSARYETPKTGR